MSDERPPWSVEKRNLSRFQFLEKLKAGFGAGGLAALLGEGLISSGTVAQALGINLSTSQRLSDFSVIVLSIIAFFAASLASDVSDQDVERRSSATKRDD